MDCKKDKQMQQPKTNNKMELFAKKYKNLTVICFCHNHKVLFCSRFARNISLLSIDCILNTDCEYLFFTLVRIFNFKFLNCFEECKMAG